MGWEVPTVTNKPIAIDRRGANIDAPDANYSGAHVRVIDKSVIIYTPTGDVHREYTYDDTPLQKAGGKVVGTVDGAPLVVDKGCGCRNKPFMISPKGVQ